jgi:hypothetical protein
LISMDIPSSVEVICESCFRKCGSLQRVTFSGDSKLARLDKDAFRESGLTSMGLPGSIELIGDGCFEGCASLEWVRFSGDSKLSQFERCAFCRNGLISRFLLVPAVEEICKRCFRKCGSLESVTFSGDQKFARVAKACVRDSSDSVYRALPSAGLRINLTFRNAMNLDCLGPGREGDLVVTFRKIGMVLICRNGSGCSPSPTI